MTGDACTYDCAEPTYVNFHSKSFCKPSRASKVISNSYGALKGAGLFRILTSKSETTDILNQGARVDIG